MSFLPGWVSDLLTLLAFIVGPSGVIWLILNQRNANRKLKVEEIGADVQQGGLTVDQFNAALPAYKDLLDRSNEDRDKALAQLAEYKAELNKFHQRHERLTRLFLVVVKQHNVQLTQEQMDELEATRPKAWGSTASTH